MRYNASKLKKISNIIDANKMYYNDEGFRPDWESEWYYYLKIFQASS